MSFIVGRNGPIGAAPLDPARLEAISALGDIDVVGGSRHDFSHLVDEDAFFGAAGSGDDVSTEADDGATIDCVDSDNEVGEVDAAAAGAPQGTSAAPFVVGRHPPPIPATPANIARLERISGLDRPDELEVVGGSRREP